jgi:thiosulfate dehydrogenase
VNGGRRCLAAAALLALTACEPETVVHVTTVRGTAVDHGAALFSDPTASPSPLNAFSCATCHPSADADPSRIFPGAALAGAPERPSFWGGQENDLLRSINHCRYYFMLAPSPWEATDVQAEAMYAYLTSLKGGSSEPAPFHLVGSIEEVPEGDRARGERVYERACASCHGAAHTGAGRIIETAVKLPDETIAEHGYLTFDERRLVFVEKVRHGAFLGYSGTMPPFSEDVLTDAELGDLLAFFDVYE